MPRSQQITPGAQLCYLDASKVDSPAGALSQMDVQTDDGQDVGELDGVLIEPAARRIRYYVIAIGRKSGTATLSSARRFAGTTGERRQSATVPNRLARTQILPGV